MSFSQKLINLFKKAAQKITQLSRLTINNIKNSLKSLWRNAESVAILSLASLGAAHFIGSYVFASPTLEALFFSDLIGPVAAVGIVWGLLRIADKRRSVRLVAQTALV